MSDEETRVEAFQSHVRALEGVGMSFPKPGMVMVGRSMYPTTNHTHHNVFTNAMGGTETPYGETRSLPPGKDNVVMSDIRIPDERTSETHTIEATSVGDKLVSMTFRPGVQYESAHQESPEAKEDLTKTAWTDTPEVAKSRRKAGDQVLDSPEDVVRAIPDRMSHFHLGTGAVSPTGDKNLQMTGDLRHRVRWHSWQNDSGQPWLMTDMTEGRFDPSTQEVKSEYDR